LLDRPRSSERAEVVAEEFLIPVWPVFPSDGLDVLKGAVVDVDVAPSHKVGESFFVPIAPVFGFWCVVGIVRHCRWAVEERWCFMVTSCVLSLSRGDEHGELMWPHSSCAPARPTMTLVDIFVSVEQVKVSR
jgi:hypothetical protein